MPADPAPGSRSPEEGSPGGEPIKPCNVHPVTRWVRPLLPMVPFSVVDTGRPARYRGPIELPGIDTPGLRPEGTPDGFPPRRQELITP